MHKRLTAIFLANFCVLLACGCTTAHDGTELKSIFDHGVAAYDAHKYEEAFKLFQSIDNEDIAAMRNEGLMLRNGLGTKKDPQAARLMLERAAEAGLPTAQYDLAEMLLDGEGGSPDPKAALPWLTLAAAAHHVVAEYRLGMLYEEGTVVNRDMNAARILLTDAAAAGVPGAKEHLAALTEPDPNAPPAAESPVKP